MERVITRKITLVYLLLLAFTSWAQAPSSTHRGTSWRSGDAFRHTVEWYKERLEAYKLVEEYRYWGIAVTQKQVQLHEEFVAFVTGVAIGGQGELWNIPRTVTYNQICRRAAYSGTEGSHGKAIESVVFALATQWPTHSHSIKPSLSTREMLAQGFGRVSDRFFDRWVRLSAWTCHGL